ncbi:beta-1,4-galactosyltransferase galt-1-like [Asterias amurensis]|uniref:beta-1,4-galactosyltransferase galt-1-like n=1 Tax=Asterias amurensis TaxID=7602 RepID=UPI003AB8B7D5
MDDHLRSVSFKASRGSKTTPSKSTFSSKKLEIACSIIIVFQITTVSLYIFYTGTKPPGRVTRVGKHEEVSPLDDPSCYLKDKLETPQLPTVHSIFADPFTNEVVVVGVRLWFERWLTEAFLCEFRGTRDEVFMSLTDPMLEDFQRFGATPQYIIIMTCPLPKALYGVPKFNMTLRRILNSTTTLSYENITVCQTGQRESKPNYLSMCTMVKNMDAAVPPWLEYHRKYGVEHVYIYDNANPATSTLRQSLRRFVEGGFLTIIPWGHDHSPRKTYLEVQIAHENDCLWRNRHRSEWMIKIDVDEFLQPMDPSMNLISDVIRRYSPVGARIGSLRIQNWFFCHGRKQPKKRNMNQHESVFERNQYSSRKPTPVNMGRDKAVVRPTNVHFFKIHGVKLGGDTITLCPRTEMRMVHYRGDNRLHPGFKCSDSQPLKDSSMCRLWAQAKGVNPNSSDPDGLNCI